MKRETENVVREWLVYWNDRQTGVPRTNLFMTKLAAVEFAERLRCHSTLFRLKAQCHFHEAPTHTWTGEVGL